MDTSALDCIQANLAAVAHLLHDIPGEIRLGPALRFRPRPLDGGRPFLTAEPTLYEQLGSARRLLGLDHAAPRDYPSAKKAAASLVSGWLFVVADAFQLPWCPYYGQTHTAHSFTLRRVENGVELLDAYTNDTPWGKARPTAWTFDPDALADLLPDAPATVVELRQAPLVPEPSPGQVVQQAADDLVEAAGDGRVDRYVHSYAAHPDEAEALTRLTVEVWLLARQRLALARWLTAHSGDAIDGRPAEALAERWLEASEATYLAMRRVQRGRPAPDGVVQRVADLLANDGAALRECAGGLEATA